MNKPFRQRPRTLRPAIRSGLPSVPLRKKKPQTYRLKFWKKSSSTTQINPSNVPPPMQSDAATPSDLSAELGDLVQESAQVVQAAAVTLKRAKWPRRVARWVAIGFVCFAAILVVTLTALALLVGGDDVARLVVRAAEEQTGGRLEIGASRLSWLTGVTFEQVTFYPPAADDARGYRNGGMVAPTAMARVERLEVAWQSLKLLMWQINVGAVKLVHPEIWIAEKDGEANYVGILRYRAAHFPPASPSQSNAPATDGGKPLQLDDLLPILPSAIFFPIRLSIQDVGFENLSLHMDSPTQAIDLEGFSAFVGLKWFAFSSELTLRLKSNEQTNGRVYYRDKNASTPQQLAARIHLDERFVFANLRKINFDMQMDIVDANINKKLVVKDLKNKIELAAEIHRLFNGITVEKFQIDALESLRYLLQADATLVNSQLDKFFLKSHQEFTLDFFALNDVLQTLYPRGQVFGAIKLDRLNIEGEVDTNKLNATNLSLPFIQANLSVTDVRAQIPELGLTMTPLNGHFAIGGGPAMIGEGSQLDAIMELALDNLTLEEKTAKGSQLFQVQRFASQLTSRLHYPNPSVPVFKLNAHAEHIRVAGDHLAPIDVPFEAEVSADYATEFAKASVDTRLELADLFSANIHGLCKRQCGYFKMDGTLMVSALDKIFAIVRPILQRTMSLKDIPETLKGSATVRLAANGDIPEPFRNTPEKIFASGKINVDAEANVNNLSVLIPGRNLVLNNFEQRLGLRGDLNSQNIELRQTLEQLSLIVPNRDKPMHVNVSGYQFNTNVDMAVKGVTAVKKLASASTATIQSKLQVDKISVPNVLPRDIDNFGVQLRLNQREMRFVNLEELRVAVPDFGLDVLAKLKTEVDSQFKPLKFAGSLSSRIDHSEGRLLPSGVRTTGGMKINVAAESKDMKRLSVDGKAHFDQFGMNVPNPADADKPLLVVEDMNGLIPLRQSIDLTKPLGNDRKGARQTNIDNLSDEEKFQAVKAKYLEASKDAMAANANQAVVLDYPGVRPFFPDRHPISIRRVSAANLDFHNLEFDVELRQNWFSINQYLIDFLGGRVAGELQVVFDPLPQAIQTSLHITRLDTRKLLDGFPKLKSKAKGWSFISDPYFDATVHGRYDLKVNDLNGAVEVTSIGKEQLKMILFYVDPKQENPTITQLRTVLNFGEINQVSIPIKNGFVGLDLDLRLLKVPIPTPQLRGFPVAQFIQNFRTANTTAEPVNNDVGNEQRNAGETEGDKDEDGSSKDRVKEGSNVNAVH